MIGRLNHIAIAVPDLGKASELYRTVMGAKVSAPKAQPAHGVTVVFVELPNTKIELLHPLGEKSPIANFLARNADGGIHHVCYEVEDIYAVCDRMMKAGVTINRPPRDGNMAFVRSPDKHSIELLQRGKPLPPQEPWASMPNSGKW